MLKWSNLLELFQNHQNLLDVFDESEAWIKRFIYQPASRNFRPISNW